MKVDQILSEEQQEQEDRMFFGFSAWCDPYGRGRPEWFIVGPYETSAEARKAVKSRLERGQPQNYRDWASGNVKVIEGVDKLRKALDKEKLNMPKRIEEDDIYLGDPALWRPSSKN